MSDSANLAIAALLYEETGTDSVKMTIGTLQQYESRLTPDDTIQRNEDHRSAMVAQRDEDRTMHYWREVLKIRRGAI
jgi:hypothetical protein